MPERTNTAYESIIALADPDNRKFDFTNTADEPHAVRIIVPKETTWQGSLPYWNENHSVHLKCVQGRCHTFSGTGLYDNVDSFFGSGSGESYGKFELHYWQRAEDWQTSQKKPTDEEACIGQRRGVDWKDPREAEHKSRNALYEGNPTPHPSTVALQDEELIVELNPFADWYEKIYAARYELFYRHVASVHLDAAIYPSLPSTPLPIRFLFKLPHFIFPDLLRQLLIRFFLSVQLYVLYSAFGHHPYLGSLPIAFLYSLLYWTKYWAPGGGARLPEWICRAQWESMIVVSHIKIWIWAGIGEKLLGMSPMYEEYTPDRLKDALDPIAGEMNIRCGKDSEKAA